ncbi:hypothetical protein H6F93_15650 [Leptolyngbya sp. FACHB-671]|uniref:hypothetical protein n=1 Tax=Leptolyngbya sp. FACHB-671 TaxID=2692812 RepID=UPI0016885F67|nr:hypothetical protein [Leptolyngbya sp. FACHB-671]MBD2068938.1 hypothetical protein [Leptolyngbya sp. FACHB-671]
MRQVEQLELPLWEMLKEAAVAPDEADLPKLLEVLDVSLSRLNTVGQLGVAAEAIGQIVEVFQERSALAFEELEATNSEEGPVMPTDAFERYVRQTMEVDFEGFIEPLASLPRKTAERPLSSDQQGSVMGEIDQVALLQALDEQMNQHPGLTEAEAFNRAIEIAHDEDVSTWVGAINQCLQERQVSTISLIRLQRLMGMPIVQLWLALLLGGYTLEQRGEFYETEQVWVCPR